MAVLFVGTSIASAHSLTGLTCQPKPDGMLLLWDPVLEADEYEVQMGLLDNKELPVGGQHSDTNSALLQQLIPRTSYWFHAAAHTSEGWTNFSNQVECTAEDVQLSTTTSPRRRAVSKPFAVTMYRQAEAGKADGIDNHNTANADGVSQYMRARTRPNCLLQRFHVEIQHEKLSGFTSPKGCGSVSYANYLACNDAGGGQYRCGPIIPVDCQWLNLNQQECAATQSNTGDSASHVGLGCQRSGGTAWGTNARLYSLPKAGVDKYWFRHKAYETAPCHKGMSGSDIEKAFPKHAIKMAPFLTDDFLFENTTSASIMV